MAMERLNDRIEPQVHHVLESFIWITFYILLIHKVDILSNQMRSLPTGNWKLADEKHTAARKNVERTFGRATVDGIMDARCVFLYTGLKEIGTFEFGGHAIGRMANELVKLLQKQNRPDDSDDDKKPEHIECDKLCAIFARAYKGLTQTPLPGYD